MPEQEAIMESVGPSFVAEVLATVGKLEKEDIAQRIGQLAERIDSIKADVHENLHLYYENFYPDLAVAQDLNGRVEDVSAEMKALSEKMQKEIHGQLLTTNREYADFSEKMAEMDSILSVLDTLVECHESIEATKQNLAAKNFVQCAESLDKLRVTLEGTEKGDVKILEALRIEYKVQSENLVYRLGECWKQLVQIDVPNDSVTSVHDKYSITVNKLPISDLLIAMNRVGILSDRLKQLSTNLLTYVFEPAVKRSANISLKNSHLAVEKGDERRLPSLVFKNIEKVLNFLAEDFLFTKVGDQTAMAIFGKHVGKQLVDMIVKDCLAVAVPTNHKDLQAFAETVLETEKFQKTLKKYEIEDSDSLVSYVSNVNTLFANKKCQLTLERARDLMKSELHNMQKVVEIKPEIKPEKKSKKGEKAKENAPEQDSKNSLPCLFKFPDCYISTSVHELMDIVYQLLTEACQSDENCALQLFYCARNVFELFICVVPTFHRDTLLELPQSAALYHNNCMYVAHHLMTLGHQFRDSKKPKLKNAITFLDQVTKIRQIGTECFMAQMRHQREQLYQFLQLADGFLSVSEHSQNQNAERAIKQVFYQLNRLQNLWQDVLPLNIYHKSIGTLVNSVLDEIMSQIISLEDISATDATQLHSLVKKIIEDTPSLLNKEEMDLSLVVKYIPQWQKFTEFQMVLNARLADIAERWASGQGPLAAQFKPTEIKQLIRSLYQNTEVRANVLAQI